MRLLKWWVTGSLMVAAVAWAQVPFSGTWSPQELPFLTLSGGTLTGALTGTAATFTGLITAGAGVYASGDCASDTYGDVTCYGNNGPQSGWPATDIAPQPFTILPQSASPLGSTNKTGAPLNAGGGWGTISSTAVQANCGAADTFTLTTLGPDGVAVSKTCTRDATTDSATLFTCGASNQAMAVNVAACLATATGVAACGGTNCTPATVGFTGTSGIIYVYPSTSEPAALTAKLASSGNHGVVTLGTEGKTLIPSVLDFATGASGTIAAADVGLSRTAANTLSVGNGTAGSAAGTVNAADFKATGGFTGTVGANSLSLHGIAGGAPYSLLASGGLMGFSSSATSYSGADTAISRVSAGVVGVGTGVVGSTAGDIQADGYLVMTGAARTTQLTTTGAVITSAGGLRFWSGTDILTGASNANVSNGGLNTLQIGSGSVYDATGTLKAATVTLSSGLTNTNTGTMGWSVVGGVNTACTTTCTNACVFGLDLVAGLVDCSSALADTCVCAGAN